MRGMAALEWIDRNAAGMPRPVAISADQVFPTLKTKTSMNARSLCATPIVASLHTVAYVLTLDQIFP
jgi:hypothetical protein